MTTEMSMDESVLESAVMHSPESRSAGTGNYAP
jgi:hypothetical protein